MLNKIIEPGGGNPSYKGYEYQKNVTAWVALTLFLDGGINAPNEIVVEPATNEDIEAQLNVPAEEASSTIVVPEATKLMVQIKFRGSGYWSSSEFATLVEDKQKKGAQGPAPRLRAKSLLLADPTRRYVLVTNIGVDGALSDGRVERIDDIPPKSFLPVGIAKETSEKLSLSGRFAVIESLIPKLLQAELRRLLETLGHVPSPQVDKAINEIKRAIEDRILGLSTPLTRSEVEAIIQTSGGLPYTDRELAEYVAPREVDTAKEILAAENAVLLIGPPGYGKSLTAKQLVLEHRLLVPPFEVVRQTVGIEGIDEYLGAPGRHVFYLDDPWGQSKLEADADRWNVELPKLLRRASPDKQFIITSRTDIFRLALGGLDETPWKTIVCLINNESYNDEARWSILELKLKLGGSWRKDFARQYRTRLFRDLKSPLALDRFAKALLAVESTEKADIQALVDEAQVESIRRIVAEQVKGWSKHGVACATILWALLRRGGKIIPDRLKTLRRELGKGTPPLEIDLEGFVKHFSPITLTRAEDGSLSAHGKVIEALEQIVNNFVVEAEQTINKTLFAYDRLRNSNESYAKEELAVVNAVKSVEASGLEMESNIRSKIDSFLIERLAKADRSSFPIAFSDVTYYASDERPLARFVRYLAHGAPKPIKGQRVLPHLGWRAPKVNQNEIAAISREPGIDRVATMFIEVILPLESEIYDADQLIPWMKLFDQDLGKPFINACRVITAHSQFMMNADTVFEGAITESEAPSYSEIFLQIEDLETRIKKDLKDRELDATRAWQGEMDFTQQLHIQDDLEDEGSAVSHAVEGYVRGRRSREGYNWIASHRRADLIMPAWAKVMRTSKPLATDELDTYFNLANTDYLREEGIRIIGEKRIHAEYSRLIDALKVGSIEARQTTIRALLWLKDRQEVEGVIAKIINEINITSQIELLIASGELADQIGGKIDVMQRIQRQAPAASQDLLNLVVLAIGEAPYAEIVTAFRRLPIELVDHVIKDVSRPFARILLSLSTHAGRSIAAVAESWLRSDDIKDVMAAVDALALVNTKEARAQIASIAIHDDYEVRREVIDKLAEESTEDERRLILEREADRSAPVREKLASLIGHYSWTSGVPVLLNLLNDHRDYTKHPEYHARNERQYEVARAAARALEEFKPFPPNVIDFIVKFVDDGNSSSRDIELHALLIDILSSANDLKIIRLFCRLLSDDRVVGGQSENLYPVRYAAAWGLFHNLNEYPEGNLAVNWDEVERAAGHADPQLAAPGLCLLGTRLKEPTAGMLTVLRTPETTETRRVLALLMMDDLATARSTAQKYALLMDNHPFLMGNLAKDATGWPVIQPFDLWLQGLNQKKDVEGVVLKVCASLMKLDLKVKDFDVTALRRKEQIPIMTTAEMFGME